MKEKSINVFLLQKPATDLATVGNWLSSLGVSEAGLDFFADSATLMSDGEYGVALAAKRCYMAFEPGLNPNVTKVRKDWHDYFENILKSGHGSVMEHAHYMFALEGVTRVFTGEMNRHRAGVAISEGSMRYISFKDIPFWMPLSIRPAEGDDEETTRKKHRTRRIFKEVVEFIETAYSDLVETWGLNEPEQFVACKCVATDQFPVGKPDSVCSTCKGTGKVRLSGLPFHEKKKITSMLRRIIPMGVSTGGIWTLNLRALRHVIALRTDPAAEEEIAYVVGEVGRIMASECKLAMQDFTQDGVTGAWVPRYKKV